MFLIFNKNKIISYIVALFMVLILFSFSTSIIPNKDVEIVKISTNIIKENEVTYANTIENNIYK